MGCHKRWLMFGAAALFWLTGAQAVNAAQNTGTLRIYNYDGQGYSFRADLSDGKKLMMSLGRAGRLSTYIPAGGSATMILRDGHYRLLLLGTPVAVNFRIRDDRRSAIKIRRGGPSGRDLLAEIIYRGRRTGIYPLVIIPVAVRQAPAVIVQQAPVIIQQAPVIVHQPAPVVIQQPPTVVYPHEHGQRTFVYPPTRGQQTVVVPSRQPTVVYPQRYGRGTVVVPQQPMVVYPQRQGQQTIVVPQGYGRGTVVYPRQPTVVYQQGHGQQTIVVPQGHGRGTVVYPRRPTVVYPQLHEQRTVVVPTYPGRHDNYTPYQRRPRHSNGMSVLFNLAFGKHH